MRSLAFQYTLQHIIGKTLLLIQIIYKSVIPFFSSSTQVNFPGSYSIGILIIVPSIDMLKLHLRISSILEFFRLINQEIHHHFQQLFISILYQYFYNIEIVLRSIPLKYRRYHLLRTQQFLHQLFIPSKSGSNQFFISIHSIPIILNLVSSIFQQPTFLNQLLNPLVPFPLLKYFHRFLRLRRSLSLLFFLSSRSLFLLLFFLNFFFFFGFFLLFFLFLLLFLKRLFLLRSLLSLRLTFLLFTFSRLNFLETFTLFLFFFLFFFFLFNFLFFFFFLLFF